MPETVVAPAETAAPSLMEQLKSQPPGHDTLEFLLRRMRLKSDFPALSESIRRVNQLARSENERIDSVSSAILEDFSLTNKILRMVNSSNYRGAHQEPVSTMSRAIMVLGFEAIRTLAISLTLFEHMNDKSRAARLRDEFVRANLRASIARSMLGAGNDISEEGHLAAMFHRLGHLLALYYFPEEFDEIERLSNTVGQSEESAARQVLGIRLEELGAGVAGTWGFPPVLLQSMAVLRPDDPVPPTSTREAHLRVLANFSADLADLAERADGARLQAGIDGLARRYGKSLDVTTPMVKAKLESAAGQVRELSKALQLNLTHTTVGRRLLAMGPGGFSDRTVRGMETAPDSDGARQEIGATLPGRSAAEAGEHHDAGSQKECRSRDSSVPGVPEVSGAPLAADLCGDAPRRQDILTNGLVELSQTLTEQSALNDVVRMAVETLYRGMALQRVLFALRDAHTNVLIGRLGFGPGMPELARAFRVPLDSQTDLFAITAKKGADLLIHDSAAENISSRIPAWYREHFGAGSFILLPLVLKASPVALIYADQPGANEITIGGHELSLVRAIRNQVVLAFKQAHSG